MPLKNRKDNPFYSISEISMKDVLNYQEHEVGNIFIIPLKTPRNEERFLDDHKHYTKSNINVCYAAPRNAGRARDWYETQLTVKKEVRDIPGYPLKGVPFYAVTDDGYGFLAHTTSQNNKQFAAIGDELILGRWIKGRLVEEKLVEPISNTVSDVERKGMITTEMLTSYGCNAIAFQKTDLRINDPIKVDISYEVWTLKMIYVDED